MRWNYRHYQKASYQSHADFQHGFKCGFGSWITIKPWSSTTIRKKIIIQVHSISCPKARWSLPQDCNLLILSNGSCKLISPNKQQTRKPNKQTKKTTTRRQAPAVVIRQKTLFCNSSTETYPAHVRWNRLAQCFWMFFLPRDDTTSMVP